MSEKNTIPQNNLPIYLQEYTISVLGDINSLECPSEPVLGGCVGTQYGCCPDGVTASNADGSNCPSEVGTIQYSTLGVIPSNKKDARVWDLKASGTLKPHDKDYIIHYDLSKVDYDGKVTFENELSGVLTVCGRVISISRKNATWYPCESKKTVSIIIDQSRWGFSIKKETPFSMDIQLDDGDDGLPKDNGGNYQKLCKYCTYGNTDLSCYCPCESGFCKACDDGTNVNCLTNKTIPSGNTQPINNCNGNLTLGECSENETCPYPDLCS